MFICRCLHISIVYSYEASGLPSHEWNPPRTPAPQSSVADKLGQH